LKRSVSSLLRTASPPPPRRSNSSAQRQSQSQPHQPNPSIRTQPLPLTALVALENAPPPAAAIPTLQHFDNPTKTAEDVMMRRNNAYPGASNTINSVHQRKWFLSLDRAMCGFRATNEFAFG